MNHDRMVYEEMSEDFKRELWDKVTMFDELVPRATSDKLRDLSRFVKDYLEELETKGFIRKDLVEDTK